MLLVYTMYIVLYSETALSREPFGIEHAYIHTFLLTITDTMTSQNTDQSSWDTLNINKKLMYLKVDLTTKRVKWQTERYYCPQFFTLKLSGQVGTI